MFDDIRGDLRIRSYVSYILVTCMLGITVLTILIPELKGLYSSGSGSVNILIRCTVPFQHGFDDVSAMIHLAVNLIFFWFLGTFLEKVIGSFRFLIITLVTYLLYVFVHRMMMLIGHGFTPVLFGYSGVMIVVMAEGRFVKTRSAFEDYYKTLIGVQAVLWLGVPLLVSFVPIYFDSQSNLLQSVIYSNVSHIVCGLAGFMLGIYFREHIREKLTQHTRKRYIKHEKIDRLAIWTSLGFPVFLILVFFLKPT